MNILLLLLLLSFITVKYSLNSIWFLRHCDKPNNNNNPCCTNIGYKRAIAWGNYLKTKIKKKSQIKFYASGFSQNKICINHKKYRSNKKCQKSQRMLLTSNFIHVNFTNDDDYAVNNFININYCIGDEKYLLNDIIQSENQYNDIIVVWEHVGIINMLNQLGVKITPWSDKYGDVYNILFHYDYINHTLTYYCYDFHTQNTNCSKNINKWLKNFNEREQMSNSLLTLTNYKYSFIIFALVICVLIISFLTFYKYTKVYYHNKNEYTIIV